MHTPVEIIDLRDAAAVTELLKETCLVWEGLNDE
jgi:putative aminopeptidase FrvX